MTFSTTSTQACTAQPPSKLFLTLHFSQRSGFDEVHPGHLTVVTTDGFTCN